MKPRNINNSLPLQPLVPDQENKNKKNEEKSVNPVKITMGSGLNYIEQESLGGKYLTHDLSIKIAGNDSNLLIVFYVQIMPDDFVMQLHRF